MKSLPSRNACSGGSAAGSAVLASAAMACILTPLSSSASLVMVCASSAHAFALSVRQTSSTRASHANEGVIEVTDECVNTRLLRKHWLSLATRVGSGADGCKASHRSQGRYLGK